MFSNFFPVIILRNSAVSVFRQRQLVKAPHLAKEPFIKITFLHITTSLTHFSSHTEYYTSNLVNIKQNTFSFRNSFIFKNMVPKGSFHL